MKNLFLYIALIFFAISCHNSAKKVVTYADAENVFLKGLTEKDTSSVLSMTDSFMENLAHGQIDSSLQMVNVLFSDTLYMPSLNYRLELIRRFSLFPVLKYELVRYSFSTEGNNDVCYKYWFNEQQSSMKIVFNPVKVDDRWYLTLKDGSQSSKDMSASKQTHSLAPAPNKISLNKSK